MRGAGRQPGSSTPTSAIDPAALDPLQHGSLRDGRHAPKLDTDLSRMSVSPTEIERYSEPDDTGRVYWNDPEQGRQGCVPQLNRTRIIPHLCLRSGYIPQHSPTPRLTSCHLLARSAATGDIEPALSEYHPSGVGLERGRHKNCCFISALVLVATDFPRGSDGTNQSRTGALGCRAHGHYTLRHRRSARRRPTCYGSNSKLRSALFSAVRPISVIENRQYPDCAS